MMNRTKGISYAPPRIRIEEKVSGFDILFHLANNKNDIADNRLVDAILRGSIPFDYHWSNPCATSTIVVYKGPNEVFGETVKSGSGCFKVPKDYQNMKDVALVLDNSTISITCPSGKLEFGKWILEGKASYALSFPTENGWYLQDGNTGMPIDIASSASDSTARYLVRSPFEHIGIVYRSFCETQERYILLDVSLIYAYNVPFIEDWPHERAGRATPHRKLLRK